MGTFEPSSFDPGTFGLLAKYHDPVIRFLMDRKFPWLKRISSAPPPGRPVGSRLAQIEPLRPKTTVEQGRITAAGAADVAQYEEHLSGLSATALKQLFDHEAANHLELMRNAAKIKERLDENQRYAGWRPADFDHWVRVALWNADEAIDLSLGKEPDPRFGWNYVSGVLQISEFARTYEKRRRLIYRAIQSGDLPNPMRPERFMHWAATLHLDVPSELTFTQTPQVPHKGEDQAASEVCVDSSPQASGQRVIQRAEFTKQYAAYVRKGATRLKEFFDGKTRKRGEIPEARQFRVRGKSGNYDLDAMIEYLRTRGEFLSSAGEVSGAVGSGKSCESGSASGSPKLSRIVVSYKFSFKVTD